MFSIRQPVGREWTACRMLLPDAFRRPAAPDAFLAWDGPATIAGAAALHFGFGPPAVDVITVRTHLRRGVGSALLRRIAERARESGAHSISATVDPAAHPVAKPFLIANGFTRRTSFLHFEGEFAGLGEAIGPALRKAPAAARVVDSRVLELPFLARWYCEHIVPDLHGAPEAAPYLFTTPEFDRLVLLHDGRPAGIVAGAVDGPGWWRLDALAVSRPYRRVGWAVALLLDAVTTSASRAGAARLRFQTAEDNDDIVPSVGRARARLVRRTTVFQADFR
jgi:GNAT superfamily N-acetyltransferase